MNLYMFVELGTHLSLICDSNKYCKTRKFSWETFSLIIPFRSFCQLNFHYSMSVLFYIITKKTILEALNFHRFASSVEMAKINLGWNFLVLQQWDFCPEFGVRTRDLHPTYRPNQHPYTRVIIETWWLTSTPNPLPQSHQPQQCHY